MSTKPGSQSPRPLVETVIEGLVRPHDIEEAMSSPEFLRAHSLEQKRQVLARWLRTRRLEKGYVVAEIDRSYRPFTDKAAAAYDRWDESQAETILRRAGVASVRPK